MNKTLRPKMPRLYWALALLALSLVLTSVTLAKRSGLFDQLDLLVDVRHQIVSEYVDAPDEKKMAQAAVRAMVESLDDPYTIYLSPEELEPFDKQVRGTFSGIGAEVDINANHLRIVTPLDDSPAWKAGVMAGDVVLEVDAAPLAEVFSKIESDGLKLREAVKRLQGPEGTQVKIKVLHPTGEEALLTVTRAQINVQTVRGWRRVGTGKWDYLLDAQHKIGYLRVSQFTETTAPGVRAALDDLLAQDVKGLILDLRFNPGGLLDSAVDVSDMFLPGGQRIVSVKGRVVAERVYTSTNPGTIPPIPMVVLANEASASAAEVVTGALVDNDRARFVGTRTFGKGSVQQIRPLDDGEGAIKITNALYYLPSGRNIHHRKNQDTWGVDPQDGFWVPMTADQTKEMLRLRRERDILPGGAEEASATAPNTSQAADQSWTPQRIEDELKDPQAAAALRALLGRLDDGQWPRVGKDGGPQIVALIKRDNLTRQRDLLNDRLQEIDTELATLDHAATQPATQPATP